MATVVKNNSRLSLAMERTGNWVFSKEFPSDVVVVVGETNFPLHKFMLVSKSNYIRKLILESKEPDLARIDLSGIPGGSEIFEKAAKFCYGVNFEITVHNVAALYCAAEFLQMTDKYCDGNLAGRTDDFLNQVAMTSFSGSVVVLKSCESLLPMAEDLKIVQRCLDVASTKWKYNPSGLSELINAKARCVDEEAYVERFICYNALKFITGEPWRQACNEANYPSRLPPNWWTSELSILNITFFEKIIASMKSRGAKASTIASAIITYTERSLPDLVRDQSGNGLKPSDSNDSNIRIHQRELLKSIVTLLPSERAAFPINFLCCLIRTAIFLGAANSLRNELETRVSMMLDHVTVDDLLVVSFTYDGEKLFDLESVRRIILGFVENEKNVAVFGDFKEVCSTAMMRVAKTVDAYLGEIATYGELSISKFNGIANLVPKGARKVDDDLYRAIDIYLKAHPNLDEVEREKVCGVMDPLKLSYEARVHASQNKRLPVQIVLHALYYDQLKIRGGTDDRNVPDAVSTRSQLQADVSLAKENEALRTELLKMKMYVSDLQKNQSGSTSAAAKGGVKRPKFFSSVSKTLGKLNPFKHGSKDTSNIVDDGVDLTKPRRRRFSLS